MSTPEFSPRIGIYGITEIGTKPSRGHNLWPAGYAAAVKAAAGIPVFLDQNAGSSWEEVLEGMDGVVFAGCQTVSHRQAEDQRLCEWVRELRLPFLGVDHGLHTLNLTFEGSIHLDLPRELPQALQHQRLPEKGDRHAIAIDPGTRLAKFYGEGEIVVNSEHGRAVNRLAKGFRISARALDGVVEAIETENDDWFAMGVQWHPASESASGLDIQLFRGFIDATRERHAATLPQLVAA